MGVFLHAHPLSETPLPPPPAACLGDTRSVSSGSEPVLQPVRSPRDGILARVVALDGAIVGYGDALFELEPT